MPKTEQNHQIEDGKLANLVFHYRYSKPCRRLRIGMLTNASKCKFMKFNDKNSTAVDIEIAIRDAYGTAIPIEMSDIERDLGLITDNKLMYESHRKRIIAKSWTSLNFTTLALKKMTFQTAVVSWNNVFGQITYLSELWWNGDDKTFDAPYKAFFKWQTAPVDEKLSKMLGVTTKAKVPWAPSQAYLLKDMKLLHRILHQNGIPTRCIDSKEVFPNFHKQQKPRSNHEKTRMLLKRTKFSKQFVADRNEENWNKIPPHIRLDAGMDQFQRYVEENLLTSLPIEEFRRGISTGEQVFKAKIHSNHRKSANPMRTDVPENMSYKQRKNLNKRMKRVLSQDEKRIVNGMFSWDNVEEEAEKYLELKTKMKIKVNENKLQASHLKDCNCLLTHCKLIRRALSKLRRHGLLEKDLNQNNHDSLCNCGRYKNHERSKLKLSFSDIQNKIYDTRCPERNFTTSRPNNRASNCNCYGKAEKCIYLFYK